MLFYHNSRFGPSQILLTPVLSDDSGVAFQVKQSILSLFKAFLGDSYPF